MPINESLAQSITGLYYYGYRFYTPELQRWLNRDPIGEGGFETLIHHSPPLKRWRVSPNLYEFVDNNPVTETDHLGLSNSILHRGRCCNKSGGDEWSLVSEGEGASEKTYWKKLKPGECVGGFFSSSDCEGMTCGGGFYVVKPYDLTGTCKHPGHDCYPYTHRRWQPGGGGDPGAQSPTDRGGPTDTPPGYVYGPRPE